MVFSSIIILTLNEKSLPSIMSEKEIVAVLALQCIGILDFLRLEKWLKKTISDYVKSRLSIILSNHVNVKILIVIL